MEHTKQLISAKTKRILTHIFILIVGLCVVGAAATIWLDGANFALTQRIMQVVGTLFLIDVGIGFSLLATYFFEKNLSETSQS